MFANDRVARRGAKRHPMFTSGFIVACGARQKRTLCFVRDLALDGAQIELTGDAIPPQSFILEIGGEPHAHHAWVVWRDGRHLGVSFREPAIADLTDAPELSIPI